MTPKSQPTGKIKFFIFFLSLIGLILIALEIYLSFHQKTLCQTKGCFLVHTFGTYDILNYIGILLFFYLTISSLFDLLNFQIFWFLNLRTYILALAVIIEGYFIGFQKWILNEYCLYCLIIASLLFLCFLLDYELPFKKRILFSDTSTSKKDITIYKIAILGSFSLFFATSLVKVPFKPLKLNYPILVYKKNCPFCEEVEDFAKKHNIPLNSYKVGKVMFLIKLLNYNNVPILIYKENGKTIVIEGAEDIKNWFKKKYLIKEKKKFEKEYKETKVKKQKEEKFQKIFKNIGKQNFLIKNNATSRSTCTIDQS